MTLNLYCKCGAGAEGEIDPKGVDGFKQAWYSVHGGEGHGDCSKELAKLAEGSTKS